MNKATAMPTSWRISTGEHSIFSAKAARSA